jgi:hypothetical protein
LPIDAAANAAVDTVALVPNGNRHEGNCTRERDEGAEEDGRGGGAGRDAAAAQRASRRYEHGREQQRDGDRQHDQA